MPLQDVLSALRVVILDDFGNVPSGNLERAAYFKERFPNLSAEEIEDFVKIPPERFGYYTGTIFSGERSVLKRNFPVTFALLESVWRSVYGEDFSGFSFVKKVHTKRPWTGNDTFSLIDSWTQFISEDSPELLKRVPYITELLAMERQAFELRKAPDVDFDKGLTIEQLAELQVAELLTCDYELSANTRFLETEYDVVSLSRHFYRTEGELLDDIKQEKHLLLASRLRNLKTRWLSLPEPLFQLLQEQRSGSVSEIAEVVVEASSEDDEAKQFEEFFTLLRDLILIDGITVSNS